MSRKRDLELAKYGISKWKYRELLYFCMQYQEKRHIQKIAKDSKEYNKYGFDFLFSKLNIAADCSTDSKLFSCQMDNFLFKFITINLYYFVFYIVV